MWAQSKYTQLCKLTDSIRQFTRSTKSRQAQRRYSSFSIKGYTWLVTPHIDILIEVPVCTFGISLAVIFPVLSTHLFPDFFQGQVILNVFSCFWNQNRNNSIFSQLIIFNCKSLSTYSLSFQCSFSYTLLRIYSIRYYFIITSRQPYGRVTVSYSMICILIIFTIRICQFIFFFISYFQLLECISHLIEGVLYLNCCQFDVSEQIAFIISTWLNIRKIFL